MFALSTSATFAQKPVKISSDFTKVAGFYNGAEKNEKNYENFSFYVRGKKRGQIIYSYYNPIPARYYNPKQVELTYLGMETKGKVKSFKVKFPSNLILIITPLRDSLEVTNEKGTYRKFFKWEYEGPVNGIGTWCSVCTQSDKESVNLVKTYFLK
jgi:hypothetical protein